jgi:hypothetical protein
MSKLDILISAFAAQQHPIVIVKIHALRWMGAFTTLSDALDLLIRPTTAKPIISDLLSSTL